MTEKRTLIEPVDVIGLEYECAHCGSRYLVPLKRFDRRVDCCPNCQEKWLSRAASAGVESDERVLSQFADYLHQLQQRTLGARVRLEIANHEE